MFIFNYISARADWRKGSSRTNDKYTKITESNDDLKKSETLKNKIDSYKYKEPFKNLCLIHDNEISNDEIGLLRWQEPELEKHGVALNMRVESGIVLYRQLRSWLRYFAHQSNTSMEILITVVLPPVVIVAIVSFLLFILENVSAVQHPSLAFYPAVSIICVLFILQGLTHCIDLNENLFDTPEKILSKWVDAISAGELTLDEFGCPGWVKGGIDITCPKGHPLSKVPGQLYGTCRSCTTAFAEHAYQCTSYPGCDYELCEKCIHCVSNSQVGRLSVSRAPQFLRVTNAGKCNGMYKHTYNDEDNDWQPCYVQDTNQHIIYWQREVFTTNHQDGVHHESPRLRIATNTKADQQDVYAHLKWSRYPPEDGWTAAGSSEEPSKANPCIEPTAYGVRTYERLEEDRYRRTMDLMKNTILWIKGVPKQKMLGVPVTARLRTHVLVSLASLLIPLMSRTLR